jgi:hypothetical protein
MQISTLNGFSRFQPKETTENISSGVAQGYHLEGPFRKIRKRIKKRRNPATQRIERAISRQASRGRKLSQPVQEDLLDYVNECKCEGTQPTLNGFLEGRAERQARRKARQSKRQKRREVRKIERTGRKSERDKKRTEKFERSARGQRRDRRQKRLAERKAKRTGRQATRKLRIAERRKRQEARQDARTDRRLSRQEERALKQAEKSGRAGIFGGGLKNIADAGSDLAKGLVDKDTYTDYADEFTQSVPMFPGVSNYMDDFLGPSDDVMSRAGEDEFLEASTDDQNFWQKYGVWIAGAGAVGLLLYANAQNKPKKNKR